MSKISVVIPVYNGEKYLCKCLDSVLNQMEKDIEIICVDDGSEDNSRDILETYQKKYRFKVLKNKKNQGLSFSRNRGIEAATGEYIFFLDADDWVTLTAFEELYFIANTYSLDILYFDSITVYESDELRQELPYNGMRNGNYEDVYTGEEMFEEFNRCNDHKVSSWGALYARRFLLDNKIFFYPGIIYEDELFYIQSLILAKRVRCVRKAYYNYYRHNDSIMTKNNMSHVDFRSLFIVYAEMLYLPILYNLSVRKRNLIQGYSKEWYIYLTRCMLCNYEDIQLDTQWQKQIYQIFKETFRFPLHYLKKINWIILRQYKYIIVYGAGNIGKEVIRLLLANDIDNFFVAVTSINTERYVNGCLIHELKDLLHLRHDSLIIVAASKKYRCEMINYAKTLDFIDVEYIDV